MRYAFCDCYSGISGDMFLGALLDAGARLGGFDLESLRAGLALLDLPDPYHLQLEEVKKGAFRAAHFSVRLPGDPGYPGGAAQTADPETPAGAGEGQSHFHDGLHEHSHTNEEPAAHQTVHSQEQPHLHPHAHHGRDWASIRRMIETSRLPGEVQATALQVFERLAQAEASVHGVPVETVHFHEVGAVDSIVDIVGAAIGLHALGVQRLYASPLPLGGGQTSSAHGPMPLPSPATLELLSAAQAPVVPARGPGELVTPTGAAILAALAEFRQPPLNLAVVGVGAGRKDFPWPNILRLWVGEAIENGSQAASGPGTHTNLEQGQVVLLETNLDNMNPEFFGFIMERLFEAGALDVFFTPIYMKKNRPASKLSVLARPEAEQALANLLLSETSTLGLRVQTLRRYEAGRQVVVVQTPYGEVPVKVKLLDGQPAGGAPEYEACAELARQHQAPVSAVYNAALKAYLRS